MQYLPKTMPGPQLELQAQKIKVNGTYRVDSVLLQLERDFHNRCYICEDSPQSVNVEHFLPHKNNVDLKFSWLNLFWACGHCNNIKGGQFDGVLNCTNDTEIEGKLEYVFSPFPMEAVVIEDLQGSESSALTASLLRSVYNGTTTLKRIESNELRKKIARQLLDINVLVLEFDDATLREDRDYFGQRIKAKVAAGAKFASFSRAYLRRFSSTLEKLRQEITGFPI